MNKLKHQDVLNAVAAFCCIGQTLDFTCISPLLMVWQHNTISFEQEVDVVCVEKNYSDPNNVLDEFRKAFNNVLSFSLEKNFDSPKEIEINFLQPLCISVLSPQNLDRILEIQHPSQYDLLCTIFIFFLVLLLWLSQQQRKALLFHKGMQLYGLFSSTSGRVLLFTFKVSRTNIPNTKVTRLNKCREPLHTLRKSPTILPRFPNLWAVMCVYNKASTTKIFLALGQILSRSKVLHKHTV